MSGFRLGRLLRLRDEQAKVAKQVWATAEREAMQAENQLDQTRAQLRSARQELGELLALEGKRSGPAMQSILSGHVTIDALTRKLQFDEGLYREARMRAAERHHAYTKCQQNVDALTTLEDRWRAEERSKRRRRDERTRDELMAAKLAALPRADR